ncbi:MAG: hypothetical protein IKQ61_01415 [Spirochaetales bacterium]|nr:hypothetical protein [Spirochaetales bacterium]
MRTGDVGYEKKVRRDGLILYNLQWPPYFYCESKFDVIKTFTEMTGVYVIFVMNKYKRLTPLMIGGAWYTGLRPSILRIFDTVTLTNVPKEISEIAADKDNKIYIKYMEIYDLSDLINIMYALRDMYPDIHFDNNGLQPTEETENVRLIDKNTKKYYRSK